MSTEEIDKLEAGPALDRLIAEQVMGWKSNGSQTSDGLPVYRVKGGQTVWLRDWKPSKRIESAWETVDRMRTASPYPFWFELTARPVGYACNFVGDTAHMAYALTPALAICRAALLAMERESLREWCARAGVEVSEVTPERAAEIMGGTPTRPGRD